MKLEPLSKADLLKIKAVNDYHLYNDPRPLTNETLEELGFEKVFNTEGKYHTVYWRLHILEDITLETYEVKSDKDNGAVAWLKTPINVPQIEYKIVGSVRMLIEALKGDE